MASRFLSMSVLCLAFCTNPEDEREMRVETVDAADTPFISSCKELGFQINRRDSFGQRGLVLEHYKQDGEEYNTQRNECVDGGI